MSTYSRRRLFLAVLFAVLSGCGSPQPVGKAGKEIADAQQAVANAKAYVEKGEFDKAAMEYSRASEIIAQGKALATSAEAPTLNALAQQAQSGVAEVQKKKADKEKADEEAKKKEEAASRFKRWRTRIPIPASVDYLDVLPANVVVAGQLKNLGASIESAKKTAVGRLVTSPEFAPFWQKLEAAIEAQRLQAGGAVGKAEFPKELQLWRARFQGQFAVALWHLDLQDPSALRLAAVAEITDPLPEAVMDELMEKTEFAPPAGPLTVTYKDVDIWMHNPSGPAVTLLGRNLVLAPNAESVKAIVDGFIKPAGFGTTPGCTAVKPSLGQKPDAMVFLDLEAYMREIAKLMGAVPGGQAYMQKVFDMAGSNGKLFGMSSTCAGDCFEDRFVVITEGEPKGFAAMAHMPPDAQPPLKALAFVPANAVLASSGYLNAAQLPAALRAYFTALDDFMKNIRKNFPQPPNAPPSPDLPAVLQAFLDKTGIDLDGIAAGVTGDTGGYVALLPGLVTQPPDIGMFLTCTSPEKAKAFCDAISKAMGAYFMPSPVKEAPLKGQTTYQLDLVALGQLLGAPIPPKFPYTPAWAVQGNRFFLASSPQALAKQLSYLDSKMDAGLLTQPEFVKALNALPAEQRKGQIMYVDMKTLLTAGAMLGLPLLQGQIQDPEVKKLVQDLPSPQELFKEIPPMIVASTPSLAHVQLKNKAGEMVQSRKIESIIRGPVPPVPTAFVLGLGLAVLIPRHAAGFERAPVAPVPPPKAPKEF